MLQPGLVSISFRNCSPEQIVTAMQDCNLRRIEWGADIHVPPDDLQHARQVKALADDRQICTAAYGSYENLARPNAAHFAQAVIPAALALGTKTIRIWAGDKNPADTDKAAFDGLVAALKTYCAAAADAGVTLCLECHPNTYTDDYVAALALLDAVGADNLKMYWQPNQFKSVGYNLAAAHALAPLTVNIHIFHWDEKNRYPLLDGLDVWKRYLEPFTACNTDIGALLEFMPDNNLESLQANALALHKLLK